MSWILFRFQASIHRVRDIQPQSLNVENDYDIVKEIGAGDYGKVLLAKHKVTKKEVSDGSTGSDRTRE